jgi:hypothetical protein
LTYTDRGRQVNHGVGPLAGEGHRLSTSDVPPEEANGAAADVFQDVSWIGGARAVDLWVEVVQDRDLVASAHQ